MLQSLHIQNYALIEILDIDFQSGFSVITGETGAGKSIILGAIGLLKGQRADIKTIRNGATKCVVEAQFNISPYGLESFFKENDIEYEPDACILRRELYASGKSRAFINDSPVSLAPMKELGDKLLDVHSQHQNLLLNNENFQMDVLDILAGDSKEVEQYAAVYHQYKKLQREFHDLQNQAKNYQQDEDYIRFQLEQLDEANLKPGELEELEQEAETLSHAEDIKAALYNVTHLMTDDENGLLTTIKSSIHTLGSLTRVYPLSEEWNERLNSCYIELKDLSHDISSSQEDIEFDPVRLDFVNGRIDLLHSLQQKHRVSSVEELIALAEDYRSRLDNIVTFDERIHELEENIKKLYHTLIEKAAALTELRNAAALKMQEQMEALLIPLGMPNVRFVVELTPDHEPNDRGMDHVTFLFSANKNGKLQNVASVASGGEIARVMLSLKALIAGAVKLPTIIFDEIDTGVSGSIAEKMANIMLEMGKSDRQVISITHLPQIAACGQQHYKVYKEETESETNSHIRQLTTEERINEIAHMLSGANLTEAALNNAQALLNNKSI